MTREYYMYVHKLVQGKKHKPKNRYTYKYEKLLVQLSYNEIAMKTRTLQEKRRLSGYINNFHQPPRRPNRA